MRPLPPELIRTLREDPTDDALRALAAHLAPASPRQAEWLELLAGPQTDDARRRADALFAAHEAEWLAPLRSVERDITVRWRRGLVVELHVAARTWLAHAPALLAAAPCVFSAHLYNVSAKVTAELARSPSLEQLDRLVIRSNVSSDPVSTKGARALGASPHVGRIRHLQLFQAQIGPHGIRDLLHPGNFTALRELDLRHNTCGGGGMKFLVEWGRSRLLEKLDVRTVGLDAADVVELAGATRLARLDTLAVGARDGTLAMIAALVRSPLPSLRRIVVLPLLPAPDETAWRALVDEAAARGRALEITGYGHDAWDRDAPPSAAAAPRAAPTPAPDSSQSASEPCPSPPTTSTPKKRRHVIT